MSVYFSSNDIAALHDEADRVFPQECCGLLLGCGMQVAGVQAARNIHGASHTHFEIDPAALIAAYRKERAGGSQVIGFYHSHPSGPPQPSVTDQAMAAGDGKIWAIIGRDARANWEITVWRDASEGFEPLSLRVQPG